MLSNPAFAGSFRVGNAFNTRVYGKDGDTISSTTNPVPVEIQGTGSISGTVGVKGVDGLTIHGPTNPLANTLYTSGGANSVSNPIFVEPGGTSTANITNASSSIAASSTAVNLTAASRHLIIKTSPDAAIVYIDLTGGTATTADFRLDPGDAIDLDLGNAITTFNYIGASAAGVISVCAH
jgi:hypothetical protein